MITASESGILTKFIHSDFCYTNPAPPKKTVLGPFTWKYTRSKPAHRLRWKQLLKRRPKRNLLRCRPTQRRRRWAERARRMAVLQMRQGWFLGRLLGSTYINGFCIHKWFLVGFVRLFWGVQKRMVWRHP